MAKKSDLFDVDVEAETEELEAVEVPEEEPERKTVTLGDKLTGRTFEAYEPPPIPRGPVPAIGNRLRYRIDPERATVIQCKWNRDYQEWSDYVVCSDRPDAREKLSILTTASWRLAPPVGVAGRKAIT